MPGVLGVYTAADLGLVEEPAAFNPAVTRGRLAIDKVRFVGEPVAVIITENRQQGEDAIEQVVVDYEVLEALVDPEAAMTSTNLIYEAAGSNVVFDTTALGMPDNTGDEYFADCPVVVTGRFVNQRVAPCPLEVRGSAVAWVPSEDGSTAAVPMAQHAGRAGRPRLDHGRQRADRRAAARHHPRRRWRLRRQDHVLPRGDPARPALQAGRPPAAVARDPLGIDDGARPRPGPDPVRHGGRQPRRQDHPLPAARHPGLWRLGRARHDPGAVHDPPDVVGGLRHPQHRSAARPASSPTRHRSLRTAAQAGRKPLPRPSELMDMFAAEIGMDPAELRRRNLIPKFTEPHTTVIGQTYDVGDFEGALDNALAAADYTALRAEQAARRASGSSKQLGIGVSVYVEITGGVDPFGEHAKIEVLDDGRAVVYTGTSPHGQGHVTAWSMLAHEQTGIPMDKIDLVWGDTDLVPTGYGTMGSRSLQQGGAAVWQASGRTRRHRPQAGREVARGQRGRRGARQGHRARSTSPARRRSRKSWAELSIAAKADSDLENGLEAATYFQASSPTFPFGSHIAVVEVDTETGQVRHLRHVACDDAGTVLNPLLLEGQIHGGVAQGTAQALLEEVRYDSDGNPITSNLADYAFISAAELPSIEIVHMETPTFVNPLGAKGIGESGTIGSTPAVQSAVVDAVSHLGVRHIDMPCTAERVWNAIEAARTGYQNSSGHRRDRDVV